MRELAEENTRLSFDRRTSHCLNVTLEEELEKAKFGSGAVLEKVSNNLKLPYNIWFYSVLKP